jgi:hypothetical protein
MDMSVRRVTATAMTNIRDNEKGRRPSSESVEEQRPSVAFRVFAGNLSGRGPCSSHPPRPGRVIAALQRAGFGESDHDERAAIAPCGVHRRLQLAALGRHGGG